MNKHPKLSLATVLLVVGVAFAIAQSNRPVTNSACCSNLFNPAMFASGGTTDAPSTLAEKKPLPKLLDLGAGKCIPCKLMAPILEQLKTNYVGTLEVEFIDVWQNPDAAKQYGVQAIPTQIFYDASGKELFRHVGFFAKEDILGKWKELGVDLAGKQPQQPKQSTQP